MSTMTYECATCTCRTCVEVHKFGSGWRRRTWSSLTPCSPSLGALTLMRARSRLIRPAARTGRTDAQTRLDESTLTLSSSRHNCYGSSPRESQQWTRHLRADSGSARAAHSKPDGRGRPSTASPSPGCMWRCLRLGGWRGVRRQKRGASAASAPPLGEPPPVPHTGHTPH